jgi:DinB superfamily
MIPPFYQRYVNLVSEKDVTSALEEQGKITAAMLRSINEEKAAFRYAPEKWSVKQVVGHVTDTERIFGYRALAIARGETKPLPGYDENVYAAAGGFDRRSMRDLAADYEAVRRVTVAFFRSLPEDAWNRSGIANEVEFDVCGLAFITLGHERHHLRVLRDRYGL